MSIRLIVEKIIENSKDNGQYSYAQLPKRIQNHSCGKVYGYRV